MNSLPDVQIGNKEPLYNIGVVSRLTGISMVTLRAWERRYQFPNAERTEGGHRLYSEGDIFRLRWVKDRTNEGMQTAQAINALKLQEKSGNIYGSGKNFSSEFKSNTQSDTFFMMTQERLLDALKIRNLKLADEIFSEALIVITIEELILQVIGPVMARIGEGWEKGVLNIAEEHLETNYLRQKLIMWMLTGPAIQSAKPIVLACAPNEWHEGSLLILGALLRRRRYPVVFLGQNLPLNDLLQIIIDIDPSIVVVVAMSQDSVSNLLEFPSKIKEKFKDGAPIFGYGGRIFIEDPEWRQKIKGTYLGSTLEEGLKTIDLLLQR